MKAVVWDDEALGAKYHDEEIPADLLEQAKEYREKMIEAAVDLDDDRHGCLPRRQGAGRGDAQGAHPQGRHHRRILPGAVRLGVQEQGRAAAARRGGGLSAVAARRAADQGHRFQRQRSRAPSGRPGAAGDACVQDHGRSVRRHHHVLPHLFRQARERHRRGQFDQGPQGAHRPHAADARQQPRRHQGSLCRRHRRARGPQGGPHRRHAVRRAEAGHPREDGIPRAGDRDRDRAEVEGRPGEARRRAGEARRRGSVVPGPHRPGVRPDHPQGDGRAASRHQDRHPPAHLQGRRQYRRAAGRVSREDHEDRSPRTTAQEADRRQRPVRARQDRAPSRCRRAAASNSRTR